MKALDPEWSRKYADDETAPVDPLANYVKDHPDCLKDLDKHWTEVMKLAEKYGFINHAYGGTAILSTCKNVFDACGADGVARILRMNNVEIPDSWEVDDGR